MKSLRQCDSSPLAMWGRELHAEKGQRPAMGAISSPGIGRSQVAGAQLRDGGWVG